MTRRIFVFDTNVLISANLKPNSVSRQAYDKALATGTLIKSSKTFEEFARKIVLPKFDKYLTAGDKTKAIVRYRDDSVLVEIRIQILESQDVDDNMFLELAVSVAADCIISGDPHLKILNPFRGIPIVSPADFLKMF
jgi:putative PIN family toxin of toxin-antitoxin system